MLGGVAHGSRSLVFLYSRTVTRLSEQRPAACQFVVTARLRRGELGCTAPPPTPRGLRVHRTPLMAALGPSPLLGRRPQLGGRSRPLRRLRCVRVAAFWPQAGRKRCAGAARQGQAAAVGAAACAATRCQQLAHSYPTAPLRMAVTGRRMMRSSPQLPSATRGLAAAAGGARRPSMRWRRRQARSVQRPAML